MNFRKVLSLFLLALAYLTPGASALQLSTARHSNTITLLPDGNFLVVGGRNDSGTTIGTAEIYYTSAATSFPISPITARSSHTATLLGNGKVLVAGGFNNSGTALDDAYLYNNQSKSWEGPISMSLGGRAAHTANLVNKGPFAGDALLCGGYTDAPAVTATCERFNRNSGALGAFESAGVASLVTARMNHAAAALKTGNIFVSGGINSSGDYLPANEIYDVENNNWTPVTALLDGRAYHTITTLNTGNVMIAGGFNGLNKYQMDTNESWYYKNRLDPGVIYQDAGSHGYLGSAELFDPNGGRVPINGASYAVMPYRTSYHASALAASGRAAFDGGRGNFIPTFFTAQPLCGPGSNLVMTPTGETTANVLPASTINLPMEIELARPVSGRVVSGDIFFSGPPAGSDASFSLEGFSALLSSGVARLDGDPIGRVTNDSLVAGQYDYDTTLREPVGTAVFTPADVTDDSPTLFATAGTITLTPATIPVESSGTFAAGYIWLRVRIEVNKAFATGSLAGRASLSAGTITADDGGYSILLTSGSGVIPTPGYPMVVGSDGTLTQWIRFDNTVRGEITNSSDTNITSSDVKFAKDLVEGLALTIYFTSTYASLYSDNAGAAYIVDTSSFVVRDMIFSTNLGFQSSTFTWLASTNPYDGAWPVFNHTYSITPTGDEFLAGGENCEETPDTDCRRLNPIFKPSTAIQTIVTIPDPGNDGGWTLETPMNESRAYHTSTLLTDSSILTCGGSDGITASDTCELQDPITRKWEYVGSMNSKRARHTATLLPNGTVLLTGGSTGTGTAAVDTAEIYYPATKRCVSTQSMSDPRLNHTATLLPDGNVLIAGGSSISTYSATAELFITTSTSWEPAGNMTTGRAQHTATLRKDGRVLLIGGVGIDGTALRTTRVYTPSSRAWAAGTSLPAGEGRYSHTATLLKDGRVLVSGGSSGFGATNRLGLYSTAGAWTMIDAVDADDNPILERANHRATLLTTGKVLLTGGETAGGTHKKAEIICTDIDVAASYGETLSRANHTAVLDLNGYVHVMGGWDGTQYLNTVQKVYQAAFPDEQGMSPRVRNPRISTTTVVDYLNRGQLMTLISDTSNFHGVTEAAGGGPGSANSSHHNPRIYLQAIDAPSGFLIDMSTAIYNSFTPGANTAWENTLSSITVQLPAGDNELPWGYYFARDAANGQYSNGRVVQVTIPRPEGYVTAPTTTGVYYSSITWSWTNAGDPNLTGTVNGYNVFAASNSVFLGTAAYAGTGTFAQTGLGSNSEVSIKVGGYNLGGSGNLMHSDTYYTLPSQPTDVTVTEAGFDHVNLTWNPNGNSDITVYEVSVSSGVDFTNPDAIETYYPFESNLTSTAAVINDRLPNVRYYFRVRATNGRWPNVPNVISAYNTPHPSTVTVSSVDNLLGSAAGDDSINWGWEESAGADFYNVYAIGASTANLIWLDSTTVNSYIQYKDSGGLFLHPNEPYRISVEAAKNDIGYGEAKGPMSYSQPVHTLARIPSLGLTPLSVTTTTLTAGWILNGNSSFTVYNIDLASDSGFTDLVSSSVVTSSVTFKDLTPNKLYYVRLTVRNQDAYPEAGLQLSLGSKYTKAASPKSVSVPVISMSGITLTWNANNNSAATIYQIRGSTHPPIISPPQTSFEQGFSTHVTFGEAYTGTSKEINGLLTSTTYYFDVTARNGEGVVTGPSQTSPAETYTLAGPDSAPAGSVAGTSDPSRTSTITGTLPNGRIVTLSVPADAFPTTTALAISSSNINRCDTHTPRLLPTISLELFSTNKAQPEAPVTLTFNYTQAESTSGVTLNAANLVLARYNPDNGDCLPLETRLETGPRRITATLNHFSLFQLMVVPTSTDLSDVVVYPNPFYINRGNGFVTIRNLPANTKVRIYTLSGAKVWEGSGGSSGMIIWKGVNEAGYRVASGIYLAAVDSPAGKKILKIAVER